jgi:IS1 family transposase
MKIRCPHCISKNVTKNGHTHHGKQNHECQKCGKQFSENSQKKVISDEAKNQIKKLLLERLSLRGICRVMDISIGWLLKFISQLYRDLPEDLNVKVIHRNKLILFNLDIEADEMWSFVGNKKNKKWIWLALDPNTNQIVGFHGGDRSKESARKLFQSLPFWYRFTADFYTDDYEAYKGIIPEKRHFISKKKTTHIERLNLTLRQRISRLVRENLAFSKIEENHIGAIKYFICNHNLEINQKALPV